mgnify:CR=1 FL=1
MLERKYSAIFSRYLKASNFPSAAFELKVARGNSLPFSAVKKHQEEALWHAKHGQLVWKIIDCGISQNCFDYFLLNKAEAYVAIKYPGTKEPALIDIDVWLAEKKRPGRKSLTEERAKELSTFLI